MRVSTLAAPHARALGSTRSASARARSLCGSVTLQPTKSGCVRQRASIAASSAGGTSIASYASAIPLASANRANSAGERLCDTG